jgi:hypothetical protein
MFALYSFAPLLRARYFAHSAVRSAEHCVNNESEQTRDVFSGATIRRCELKLELATVRSSLLWLCGFTLRCFRVRFARNDAPTRVELSIFFYGSGPSAI